jgi:3-oxoadipate enol-lactonase
MSDDRQAPMRRAPLRDFEVGYRVEGMRDAPVVMLAHGVLTDHRMWDVLAEAIGRHYAVLRYDLRGHGASTAPPGPYTMDALADDAVALLDALDLPRVHFIGSSLGGMIGQNLGARHGERFVSLTLANTTATQGAPALWQERIEKARREGVGALAEPTLQRWFTPEFLQTAPAEVQRMRELLLGTSVEGFAGCADAISRLAQRDLLARIDCPTLVIAGAQDQATPPELARDLHAGIHGARFALIQQAGHQSAVEQPAAFLDAWRTFVNSIDQPS